MNSLSRFFLVVPFLLLTLTACRESADAPASYAFITNGVAEFWTIAEAAKQAGTDLGVEVSVFMPESLSDETNDGRCRDPGL